jgi:hypothetical protein
MDKVLRWLRGIFRPSLTVLDIRYVDPDATMKYYRALLNGPRSPRDNVILSGIESPYG